MTTQSIELCRALIAPEPYSTARKSTVLAKKGSENTRAVSMSHLGEEELLGSPAEVGSDLIPRQALRGNGQHRRAHRTSTREARGSVRRQDCRDRQDHRSTHGPSTG